MLSAKISTKFINFRIIGQNDIRCEFRIKEFGSIVKIKDNKYTLIQKVCNNYIDSVEN